MTKIKATYKNTLAYLKNKFSNKESHAFEKSTQSDVFEEEALEGLQSLSAAELEEDYKKLQLSINQKTKQKKSKLIFLRTRIAASILLFIGLGSLVYVLNLKQPMLNEFEEINPVVMDQEVESLKNIEEFDETKLNEIVTDDDNDVIVNAELEEIIEEKIEKQKTVRKTSARKKIINRPKVKITSVKESIKENEITVSNYKALDKKHVSRAIVSIQSDSLASLNSVSLTSNLNGKVDGIKIKENNLINGIVTDSEGQPLPGVNIINSETNIGVVSDFDGKFKLEAEKNSPLEFNYLGFEKLIMDANDNMSIALQEDTSSLDEIVVVGYGSTKKRKKNKTNPKKEIEPIKSIPPGENIETFKTWVLNQIDTTLFEANKIYKIKCSFIINKKGQITNIKVFKYKKRKIKKAFKAALMKSPLWKPSVTKEGVFVDEKIQLIFNIPSN
ncbi:carboxypeptidase-like regulatory domain-containing protein [Bacteroidota bacterium]